MMRLSKSIKLRLFSKILLPFIFSFLLVGCSSNKNVDDELLNKINELVQKDNNDDFICYIVTEYDCSLCIESIYLWQKDVEGKSNLFQGGIIYVNNDNESINSVTKRLKLPDGINWHITSDAEFFEFLAKKFPNVKPPRVIYVTDGKIGFVKSINLSSF